MKAILFSNYTQFKNEQEKVIYLKRRTIFVYGLQDISTSISVQIEIIKVPVPDAEPYTNVTRFVSTWTGKLITK